MKTTSLPLLSCPNCRGPLEGSFSSLTSVQSGKLICNLCGSEYRIEDGIPHFIEQAELTGLNRRFSAMYNWFSWGYRLFSKAAFALIGMSEETGRREITNRLAPRGGRVLEVSIGPGVNLPYLINRTDVGEIFGLDISLGQLLRCQSYIRRKGWEVDLFLGNGERLPFRDDTFDGVLHVGGINFFNDKQAAILEMSRVARSGATILISDETEKGVRGYEKVIPGFSKSFSSKRPEVVPPIDLVPIEMLDKKIFDVWKGWFYCIEFIKP